MALTKQAKDQLIAELADQLDLLELHKQVHRNTKALESMAAQLEAKGLVSVVKTFRRAGADPQLLRRAGSSLLAMADHSASTSAAKTATRRRSRRA